MSKRLIGLTGPSAFTQECIDMMEDFYEADFVMLYQNNTDNLIRWVDRCDGVVLAGGVDIHPTVYNNPVWNNQGFSKFDLKRDIREIQIIDRCKETKKPMFGICRGHQLIGITYGLFLIPDLSGSSICHQPQRQQISLDKNEPIHSVQLVKPEEYYNYFPGRDPEERMWFKRIMGYDQNTKLWTNSFHHQGLACPQKKDWPTDFIIFGTARVDLDKDRLKSIIELMGGNHWVSCQWHPEYDWRVNTASRAVLERFKVIMSKRQSRPAMIEVREETPSGEVDEPAK